MKCEGDLFNAVVILVRNIKSDRLHPAALVNSAAQPTVYRSKLFHENGFKKASDAIAHAKGDMTQAILENAASKVSYWLDNPQDWDAKRIPTIEMRFTGSDDEGNLTLLP